MRHGKQDDDRRINVLLVEDDAVDVETVRRAFRRNRISNPLWVAGDGVEALQMLRSGEVPLARMLVLLDLNMPRMGGIELLQQIRQNPELEHLPVVVLTTSDSERERVEAYKLNVAGYIVKPVTFMTFVEAIATLNSYWTLSELP